MYINGKRICYGPAKGDLKTYKYDIIDIAPLLVRGKNLIAAVVYNAGKDKPMALFSVQTAFLLRAEDQDHGYVNSNESWKVYKNPAIQPVSYQEMLFKDRWFYGYYACGPGDNLDATFYPWGWELLEHDDKHWKDAECLEFEGSPPWNLVPRNIPFMDAYWEGPAKIRRAQNVDIPDKYLQLDQKATIPANREAIILFDFEKLTMGYPSLKTDGGEGSSIQIKYAEALYEKVNLKAHRDSVEGKIMFGVWDVFKPDGKLRTFSPLWKRCFRYIQLNIKTGNDPLDIFPIKNEYSGYPYPDMSTFKSDNPKLNRIFEMGLRTLKMCSGETYYDTPFYEQLSYGGDNRPIAALSTYNSTDDRLLREVLRLYPQSENRETGLFKSAYPSRFNFDMGSWSLAWIQTLYDYHLIRNDSAFSVQFVENIEKVLGFYNRHIDESMGMLGTVRNQNFMDWSISKGSIPRSNERKEMIHSTILTLYYVHTLDCVVKLYRLLGLEQKLMPWQQEALQIKEAVRKYCWNDELQLFADNPDKTTYSQHTNILAILCDVVPQDGQKPLLEKVLKYRDFDEFASSYFSFYLFKAMRKTGQEHLFLNHLDFWHQFIDRGHTTTGETGFASHDRSDCHAWSAHPSYFLLSSVVGILPGDVGFNTVLIKPHLGNLHQVNASLPHPAGTIQVQYEKLNQSWVATIDLPQGMHGKLEFNEYSYHLRSGNNKITMHN